QSQVPERVKDAVDELGQVGQRLVGGDLPVVQEHEIDVTVRVQLGAAITADGDQGERREFLLRLVRQAAAGGVPEMFQQDVEDGRARLADLITAGPGAMLDLQAMG